MVDFFLKWTSCSTDLWICGFVLYVRRVDDFRAMAADGAALAEVRAGITLGVELYVPWDAPEAVVDISSEGVVPLRNVPDVVGRREGAAEKSCASGPGHSQCESTGSGLSGSGPEFSRCHNCRYGIGAGIVSFHSRVIGAKSAMAPAVLRHMGWHQQELEEMRSVAKQCFRQSRPSSCVYCGSLIKCDMYRHVARFHLDLAQLWWCPVSWCTVWKGTPQDSLVHLHGAHDVPWEVKSACLEQFLLRG